MKNNLILFSMLAAAGPTMAQSSVTLYGMVDAAMTHISQNGGSQNLLMDGGSDTSRFGFRGTEDLGGGLKAKFEIETELDVSSPKTGSIGDRQAWVSLASESYGEIRLGRDYNGGFFNTVLFSPWIANGVGQSIGLTTRLLENLDSNTNNRNFTRNNNSISYILPAKFGGIYGTIQHAFDEQADSKSGQSTNLRFGYVTGPTDVAFGYEKFNGDESGATSVRDMKSVNVGGSYDFGTIKLMGVWSKDEYKNAVTGQPTLSMKNMEVSAAIPLGSGRVRTSYGRVEFDDHQPIANREAEKFAIGYVYDLSKRTSVYSSYARVNNKNGANVGVHFNAAAPAANRSSTGIDFGILHTF